MEKLHCCHLDGPDGYNNKTLPDSCCPQEIRPCLINELKVYHAGCIDKAHHLLISGSKIIGGVALGIALAEIFGAFFGFCLSSSIKNQYRRSAYA